MFPILGGRLLKYEKAFRADVILFVSNPWREAIEEPTKPSSTLLRLVSNPWREAIEGVVKGHFGFCGNSFQSLEGGY